MEVSTAMGESCCRCGGKAGLIDTPEKGSYDFYRLLTVLHRKGII